MNHREFKTDEEWFDEGTKLFGPDRTQWVFQCPRCKLKTSIAIAREKWPGLKGTDWRPHQECIGRYLKDEGCDWAAYGLFNIGWTVKETPVFPFAEMEGE